MDRQKVVTRAEWLAARQQYLIKEKQFTRLRDRLSAERRELPWVKVDKSYAFDGPKGRQTLADLFGNNSQLIIQHFMWRDDLGLGCTGCSIHTDHADAALVHLQNHDVSFVMVSRAPLADLIGYRRRMGWTIPWVSSLGSDFNYDYHVSFTRAERDLGFRAVHTPAEGAREIYEALKLGRVDTGIRTVTVKWYQHIMDAKRLVDELEIAGRLL